MIDSRSAQSLQVAGFDDADPGHWVIESSLPLVDGAPAAPYSETKLHPAESCTP